MISSDWRSQIFIKKKNGGPNLGPTGLNQAQNEIFRHFVEFGSYVFLETGHGDCLWQCLTASIGKTHEKN